MERPVELTQSRARHNQGQAKATISRPRKVTVQPAIHLIADARVTLRDLAMVSHISGYHIKSMGLNNYKGK